MSNFFYGMIMFESWQNGDEGDGVFSDWIDSPLKSIFHYVSLFLPAVALVFLTEPKDHFAEYNIYPEQIHRVSVFQYEHINYNRFRTVEEIHERISFIQEENLQLLYTG